MLIASKLLDKFLLKIDGETLALLQSYEWPGNIRQLKNIVEWLLIMHGNKKDYKIKINDLPPEILKKESEKNKSPNENYNIPLKEARKKFEKNYLQKQLIRFKGNIARTSSFVGMDRSALHRKIKELDININD